MTGIILLVIYTVVMLAVTFKDRAGDSLAFNVANRNIGMKPEEVFRLSDFTREDFLKLMTKNVNGYSRAEIIKNV